ncbi:DUF6527 family protein [Citreimonas salinaria]|uniref:DUF6527 family protein n=1 Tax=Citreimonas salinaria TaxID=321339 RepID=UPI001C431D1D|nr:DUF6527 family protein [Citreimonas salinaria]
MTEISDAIGIHSEAIEAARQDLPTGASPLRALPYVDRAAHRASGQPGAVWFSDPGSSRVSALWFVCPCGCGAVSRITVGMEHKPHMAGPSWRWNGSTNEPTLHPSVHQRDCGWHGWLRDGYWERC